MLNDVKRDLIYRQLKMFAKMPVPRIDYDALLQDVPKELHAQFKEFRDSVSINHMDEINQNVLAKYMRSAEKIDVEKVLFILNLKGFDHTVIDSNSMNLLLIAAACAAPKPIFE